MITDMIPVSPITDIYDRYEMRGILIYYTDTIILITLSSGPN